MKYNTLLLELIYYSKMENILCVLQIYYFDFQIYNFKFEMKFDFTQLVQNYVLQIL